MTAPLRWTRSSSAQLALAFLALLTGCWRVPDLTLTFQLHNGATAPPGAALAEARNTIRARLDRLGVSPAVVETAGVDRIEVRMARDDDSERVRRVLLTPARFELRFVRLPADRLPLSSREEVLAQLGGELPAELEILAEEVRGKDGGASSSRYYAVEREPVLSGHDLKSARPGRGQFGDPIVEFSVKPEAATGFAKATGAHIGSLLAIVFDGRVVSAPQVRSKIGESGMIEGGFTQEQAEDLVVLLRSGPLPGRLTLVAERVEEAGR